MEVSPSVFIYLFWSKQRWCISTDVARDDVFDMLNNKCYLVLNKEQGLQVSSGKRRHISAIVVEMGGYGINLSVLSTVIDCYRILHASFMLSTSISSKNTVQFPDRLYCSLWVVKILIALMLLWCVT